MICLVRSDDIGVSAGTVGKINIANKISIVIPLFMF